jgi:hypothetical protein
MNQSISEMPAYNPHYIPFIVYKGAILGSHKLTATGPDLIWCRVRNARFA